MKTKYILTGIVFFQCVFAAIDLLAFGQYDNSGKQDSTIMQYRKSYWFDMGPGWSSRDMAFSLSLNFELKRSKVFSIGVENVFSPDPFASLVVFPLVAPTYKPGYDISAVNIKLGKIKKGKAGMIVFSGGLSYTKGTEYSSSAQLGTPSGMGVAFDAKFILAKKFTGLSLNPFLNINSIQPYGGITINIAIGPLHYTNLFSN